MKPNTDMLSRLAERAIDWDPPLPLLPLGDTPVSNYPWFIREVDRLLGDGVKSRSLFVPRMAEFGGHLTIFSDYGGEHHGARFGTYSFLVSTTSAMALVTQRAREVRAPLGLNDPLREISYKELRSGAVRTALERGWLTAIEGLPGLLLTLVIDTRLVSVVGADQRDTTQEIASLLTERYAAEWKPQVAERLLRIVHTVCYLTGLLLSEGQGLFWMSDHDRIAGSEAQTRGLQKLWGGVLASYLDRKPGKMGFGHPFAKADRVANPDLDISEFVSIPDLVAGAVSQFFEASLETEDPMVKPGAEMVLRWLCHQGVLLKKATIAFKKVDEGVETSLLSFRLDQAVETPQAVVVQDPRTKR